jgi:hypothetical protein
VPATRPRVPGWHPDPEDPSFLRHWDGRRWGRERRPRPSWAPLTPGVVTTAPLAPPSGEGGTGGGSGGGSPPPPGRVRRWGLVGGAAVLVSLLIIALSVWLSDGPDIPPRSVADVAFTDEAEAVCADKLPPLRAARPESREDSGTAAEFARRIDRAADGLEDVIRDLRALPVAAPDAAEVDGWLDDWDAYVTVGRGYADRLRGGDAASTAEVEAAGTRLSRSIFLFARSNGMPSCAL